jgi:hypothetical protein
MLVFLFYWNWLNAYFQIVCHGAFSAISCMCFPVALEDVLHPASHPGGICLKDMFRVGDALTLPAM